MAKTVIGVYDSEQEVVDAVESLKTEGYKPEDISLVANESEETSWIRNQTDVSAETNGGQTDSSHNENDSFWEKAKSAFLGEEDTHNNDNGYFNRLKDLGLSEEEAHKYDSEVQTGKVVVLAPENGNGLNAGGTSETTDYGNNLSEADSARRPENKHDSAVNGTSPAGGSVTNSNVTSPGNGIADNREETDEERKMRLREEELEIDKQNLKSGEVEVRKEVREETKRVDVPVTKEEVYVDKKPVTGKSADASAEGEIEDETIRVPLKEEKVEVKKKPVVTDEVEIGKRKVEETEQVQDNVKKEELHVDREGEKDSTQRNKDNRGGLFEDRDKDNDKPL
ncbi:YsnF/AvaK domain-containing protein [Salipaludibacillus sp. CUR1]|uniref:YsnF/AvaK domain-containing protein n=1 Tax=Salipaludibacillus sp. CUR1 TaxID=2820003 RepID=UPI001E5DD20D|nr:YsnF/AvaK domain-containing protein [Salipaludibacillus sp. CUR1]MCE7792879.1 YsnF/AvaK domain-containing protein [Salipaludibacillus sp. CUR1]